MCIRTPLDSSESNTELLCCYPKSEQSIKAEIQRLLPEIPAERTYRTYRTLVELDFDAVNVKQRSSKKMSQGGGNLLLNFPLFMVIIHRNRKLQEYSD
jgi:hypothetical protein